MSLDLTLPRPTIDAPLDIVAGPFVLRPVRRSDAGLFAAWLRERSPSPIPCPPAHRKPLWPAP